MQTVNIRDILRSHKQVLDRVKGKKERLTIVSEKQPQAGIVSLDDLKKLEELDQLERNTASTQALLNAAKKVHQLLNEKGEELPTDLSDRHDYYHYEEGTRN